MKSSILTAICVLAASLAANATDMPAADNTGLNERDRSGATITPMDQSNSKADIEMVAAIRSAILDDERLSVMAKNIKVIANGGHVTLRGPVENTDERETIAMLVRAIPGVVSIDDQLEIKH
jgi:osmotically-inducible protein OsmY